MPMIKGATRLQLKSVLNTPIKMASFPTETGYMIIITEVKVNTRQQLMFDCWYRGWSRVDYRLTGNVYAKDWYLDIPEE